MINALNYCNVTIVSVSSNKKNIEETITKFKLQVSSLDDLDKAMLALKKMPEVYIVERIFK